MPDISVPLMLIFSAKPGDTSTAIEFAGTDWRARVMAGMSSAEIAADVVQALNAHATARKALLAVRAACRDTDTNNALLNAATEKVVAALAAMGERS